MTEADALLQAILNDSSDEPRLICADWLEEQGDPRGTFMRCQVELARWVPDRKRREALQKREQELLAEHEAEWVGDLAEYLLDWRFERGLLQISMRAFTFATKKFGKVAEALFRSAWVERVHLQKMGPPLWNYRRVADSPQLHLIRHLDLSQEVMSSGMMWQFCNSSNLGPLLSLSLANGALDASDERAIVLLTDLPNLDHLRRLDLHNNPLGQSVAMNSLFVSEFLACLQGKRLQHLELFGHDFNAAATRTYVTWRGRRMKHEPRRMCNSLGMEFALIPAGTFLMGSPETEEGRQEDEGPQHEVEITRSFWLGCHQVTQQQFQEVMGRDPSQFANAMYPVPVDSVSPHDAAEFCERLGRLPAERRKKHTYRLPTEAEWEHACRAGTTTAFWWGNTATAEQANFQANLPYGTDAAGSTHNAPTRIGSYDPNPFGLYDMHGNMWDWVSDYYDKEYFQNSPREDPHGPTSDIRSVIKGGSWFNGAVWCRSAARYGSTNDTGSNCISFRVVLEIGANDHKLNGVKRKERREPSPRSPSETIPFYHNVDSKNPPLDEAPESVI